MARLYTCKISMKPLNYYMGEVIAPPQIESFILESRSENNGRSCRDLMRDLLDALGTGWFRPNSYGWTDQWIAVQSADTWRRLIRWLAMEVI